ncbi:unnamed protein product [Clonostachys solani]|uniref:AAA+ ATPase domain-containing protein n=1 Tax=Clonostachys solani TaxID=160281 RepID=A0A9P0EHM6_9HYPO|nr:unnamed protein product [Clonostachys solani]
MDADSPVVPAPDWFLRNCVKTAPEINRLAAQISLRGEKSTKEPVAKAPKPGAKSRNEKDGSAKKAASNRYEVEPCIYDALLGLVAAKSKEGKAASFTDDAVLLRLPDSDYPGRDFLVSMVAKLASDVEADMIVLDSDDLHDLAEYFYLRHIPQPPLGNRGSLHHFLKPLPKPKPKKPQKKPKSDSGLSPPNDSTPASDADSGSDADSDSGSDSDPSPDSGSKSDADTDWESGAESVLSLDSTSKPRKPISDPPPPPPATYKTTYLLSHRSDKMASIYSGQAFAPRRSMASRHSSLHRALSRTVSEFRTISSMLLWLMDLRKGRTRPQEPAEDLKSPPVKNQIKENAATFYRAILSSPHARAALDEKDAEAKKKADEMKQAEDTKAEVKANLINEAETTEVEAKVNGIKESKVEEHNASVNGVKKIEVQENGVEEGAVKENGVKTNGVKESDTKENGVKNSEAKEKGVKINGVRKEEEKKKMEVELNGVKESEVEETEVKESEVKENGVAADEEKKAGEKDDEKENGEGDSEGKEKSGSDDKSAKVGDNEAGNSGDNPPTEQPQPRGHFTFQDPKGKNSRPIILVIPQLEKFSHVTNFAFRGLKALKAASPHLKKRMITITTTSRADKPPPSSGKRSASLFPDSPSQPELPRASVFSVRHFGLRPNLFELPIFPIRSLAQVASFSSDKDLASQRHSIRKLQREMRVKENYRSLPHLQPYAEWNIPDSDSNPITKYLRGGKLHAIPESIKVGSMLEKTKKAAKLEDILAALKQISEGSEALSKWNERDAKRGSSADLPPRVVRVIKRVTEEAEQSYSEFNADLEIMKTLVHPSELSQGWSDIEVEPAIKSRVQRMISLLNRRAELTGILKKAAMGGVILYGPPGTGKTHLARVIAKETSSVMLRISAAEIERTWAGEAEKVIQALFKLAREIYPCIVFIDEADSIFGRRKDSDKNWERKITNQLLGEFGGFENDITSPLLLLATNFPNDLDPAVLRRAPNRLYMGLPSTPSRQNIFRICLREEKMDESVDLKELAESTSGYTGSDIEYICQQAAMAALEDFENGGSEESDSRGICLRMSHFSQTLTGASPSVSGPSMTGIESFAREYDRSAVDMIKRTTDDFGGFSSYFDNYKYHCHHSINSPARPISRSGTVIVARAPSALLGIERKADGAEAAARTLGQVRIRQQVNGGILTVVGGRGLAVLEGDTGNTVPSWLISVPWVGHQFLPWKETYAVEPSSANLISRGAVCGGSARRGGIVHRIFCIVNSEAVARLERADVGEIVGPPDREARGISVITTVRLLRSTVIVQLLPRIVVVNILALALQLVDGVLDRPDTAGGGMLGDTDRVAQTPANDVAIRVLDPVAVLAEEGDVEAADLRTA